MDQLLGIFINFLVFISDRVDCPERQHVKYHYEYEVPEGINIFRDWEKDGYLSINDGFENSMEISGAINTNLQERIEVFKGNTPLPILEESPIGDDAYKFILDNPGPIDPYNKIIFLEKDYAILGLYFYNQGDPSKHAAFEENALKLARSIVQGDPYETRKKRNCGHPSFWDLLPRW